MALAAEDLAELVDEIAGATRAVQELVDVLGGLAGAQDAAAAAARANASAQAAIGGAASQAAAQADKSAASAARDAASQEKRIALSETLSGALDKTNSAITKLGDAGIMSSKSVGQLTGALSEGAAALGPYAAAAEIAIAAVTWLAGKIYDLAEAAVRLTQEKDALRTTFDAFTGGEGDALLGHFEDLASKLPFTADKLNDWGQALLAAGVQGEALDSSLQAIAASAALLPKNGGAAAEGLIKRFAMMAAAGQEVTLDRRILNQLGEAGVRVEDLAKALGVPAEKLGGMKLAADKLGDAMKNALISKGGPALARMGDTWGSISAKLTEGWEDAFEDLGEIVGPFMAQLRSLASEFFAGSIAGGTLKDVIRGVLTPVFEIATRTVRAMHIAFLYAQIAYLKAAIALRPVSEVLDKINIGGKIVTVVMYVLAGTAVTLAVAFGLLAVAVFLAALPFIILGVALFAVGYGIAYLVGLIGDVIANFDNLSSAASSAGSSMIQGLGNAIASGAAWVVGLVKGLASSIIGAITGPLQIKSPSRVMHRLGGYTTEGLGEGITDGGDDVVQAMTDVAGGTVTAARRGGARGARAGQGAAGGGRTFAPVFNSCTFGSGLTEADVRDWMSRWWEEMAAAGPEPEPA